MLKHLFSHPIKKLKISEIISNNFLCKNFCYKFMLMNY